MSRDREFSRATKRDALKRSGQLCEAVGPMYGLEEGRRCNANLGYGVQFDHVIEHELGGDASLENCAAICPACHKVKTAKGIKAIRKADRMRDKNNGTWKRKGAAMPGSRASRWKRKIGGGVVERE